jgi:hypothetical protein
MHSVFTLHGGFLVAIDFNTPNSCQTFSALLSADLDQVGSQNFQEEVFDRFLASVDLALNYNQCVRAVSSWVNSVERIREWVCVNPAWGKEATKVWDEFLATREGKKARCSCGKQTPKETFKGHLKKAHWWGQGSKSVKKESRMAWTDTKKALKRKVEDEPEAKEEQMTLKRAMR